MKKINNFFGKVSELFSERVTEDVSPEVCAEANYSCENARGEFIPGTGPRLQEQEDDKRESREARSSRGRQVELC